MNGSTDGSTDGQKPGEHQHESQQQESIHSVACGGANASTQDSQAQQTLAFGQATPCASSQPEPTVVAEAAAVAAVSVAVNEPVVAVAPVLEASAPVTANPEATVATTITESTAKDFAAALKTAHRARAAQAAASASRPRESDLVARRIVLRRDRWEALLGLANALQAQRGVAASPAEVAAIVLDAGLNVILEESRAAKAPRATAKRGPGRPPSAHRGPGTTAHGRAARSRRAKARRNHGHGAAAGAVKARAPRPSAARPKPRTFAAGELGSVRGLVRTLKSQRSVQRTVALWLGAQGKGDVQIPVEDLRALCREFKVYDTANFAQNMKKDSAWFIEVRDRDGERLGYALTSKGATAAAELLAVHAKR